LRCLIGRRGGHRCGRRRGLLGGGHLCRGRGRLRCRSIAGLLDQRGRPAGRRARRCRRASLRRLPLGELGSTGLNGPGGRCRVSGCIVRRRGHRHRLIGRPGRVRGVRGQRSRQGRLRRGSNRWTRRDAARHGSPCRQVAGLGRTGGTLSTGSGPSDRPEGGEGCALRRVALKRGLRRACARPSRGRCPGLGRGSPRRGGRSGRSRRRRVGAGILNRAQNAAEGVAAVRHGGRCCQWGGCRTLKRHGGDGGGHGRLSCEWRGKTVVTNATKPLDRDYASKSRAKWKYACTRQCDESDRQNLPGRFCYTRQKLPPSPTCAVRISAAFTSGTVPAE
jgi:hypothetical protein